MKVRLNMARISANSVCLCMLMADYSKYDACVIWVTGYRKSSLVFNMLPSLCFFMIVAMHSQIICCCLLMWSNIIEDAMSMLTTDSWKACFLSGLAMTTYEVENEAEGVAWNLPVFAPPPTDLLSPSLPSILLYSSLLHLVASYSRFSLPCANLYPYSPHHLLSIPLGAQRSALPTCAWLTEPGPLGPSWAVGPEPIYALPAWARHGLGLGLAHLGLAQPWSTWICGGLSAGGGK